MTVDDCGNVLNWASYDVIPSQLIDLDKSTLTEREIGEDAEPHLFSLRRLFTATGDMVEACICLALLPVLTGIKYVSA